MKMPRVKTDGEETPKERFKRLATARTRAILEKIRVLGNCSNTAIYDFSSDEVDQIFAAIEKELRRTKQKFKAGSDGSDSREFVLE
jgi:hypothetical protein